MAQAARLSLRLQKELKLLLTDPPPNTTFPFLSADANFSSLTAIDAHMEGPEGTVYSKGTFKIKIQVTERYPFQPPIVTFATPIYHPNIDTGGRICLDILNLPPKGAWQPSLNISTVITSIMLLLTEPNPDDGLMCEASREYKYNRQAFDQKARAMTEKHAKTGVCEQSLGSQSVQVQSDSAKMEARLETGSKSEVAEGVPRDEKPSGICKKLSLEPSILSVAKSTDGGRTEVLRDQSLADLENPSLKGKHGTLEGTSDIYSARYNKMSMNRRKLSLGAKDEVAEPRQTAHSLQPLSTNGSLIAHVDSCEDDNFPTHRSTDKDVKKLCPGIKLVLSEISTSRSRSDMSTEAAMSSRLNNTALQAVKTDPDTKDNDWKKGGSVRKKLSLGPKGISPSLSQERVGKENIKPIEKSQSWGPQIPIGKNNMGKRKLSLAPLTELQGGNEGISHVQMHSHDRSNDASKRQLSSLQQSSKVACETGHPEEKSWPAAESVIVLDSEDSEEENSGLTRSKLFLARQGLLKRKKAHRA